MKSNFPSRFLFVLTVAFATINMFSCKSYDKLFDTGDYIFENQTDYKTYFVKIDTIEDVKVNGRIYLVDNELTMRAETFTMTCKKNKCNLMFSDSSAFVLNIKRFKNERIEGTFVESSKKKKFVMYKYKTDEYKGFNLGRYKNEVFDVERIPDVNYANVKGFWSSIPDDTIDVAGIIKTSVLNSLKKKVLELDMDIYLPKNDTLDKRPLLMLIHGGAFFIGDKATVPYQKWCTHFASLGYVCASINYRMGFRPSSKAIQRTAYQATQDAHAAMRYLMAKKDIYRIDPENLFV
jgi:ribosomal protein L21